MGLQNILMRIKTKGYYPILAHPERYVYMGENDYIRLKALNVKFQLNLPSLTGMYMAEVERKARWLLKTICMIYGQRPAPPENLERKCFWQTNPWKHVANVTRSCGNAFLGMKCSPLRIQIVTKPLDYRRVAQASKNKWKSIRGCSNRHYRTPNNWINLFQPVYLDELTVRALMHTVGK